jgi:hypothetical protein
MIRTMTAGCLLAALLLTAGCGVSTPPPPTGQLSLPPPPVAGGGKAPAGATFKAPTGGGEAAK